MSLTLIDYLVIATVTGGLLVLLALVVIAVFALILVRPSDPPDYGDSDSSGGRP